MTSDFAVAVHALVYLNRRKDTVSSEGLASNVCTNPARVRKIMVKLKRADIVKTKEGLDGGYQFIKEADEVNLKQICEALEAKVVSASWKSGNVEKDCAIASGMAGVMDEIYGELDDLCKSALENISIQDIETRIFKNKMRK